MIEASLKLGRNLINSDNGVGKKDKFLQSQAIIPQSVEDDKATGDREVVIDLDTENQVIDIYLGDELILQNKSKFFAFKSPANSKKFYFATNNIHYHLVSLDEMIRYIQEKLDNQYSDFSQYLIDLRSQFYQKNDEDGWFLDPTKLKENLRAQYQKYSGEKSTKDNVRDTLEELVSKNVLGSSRKKFVTNLNVFTLKFDGIRAHEEGFPFYKEYTDIIFYNLQSRFFDDSKPMVKTNAVCSGCQKTRKVRKN